jgi:hypothetical protein
MGLFENVPRLGYRPRTVAGGAPADGHSRGIREQRRLVSGAAGAWVSIDWSNRLDRTAAMHGVFVYSLRQALALARKCGDEPRAAEHGRRIPQLAAAGRTAFYDAERQICVSGPKRQISWATRAWMVLPGILTKAEGAQAFRAIRDMPDAVRPGAPYLYRYVAEAIAECGLVRQIFICPTIPGQPPGSARSCPTTPRGCRHSAHSVMLQLSNS